MTHRRPWSFLLLIACAMPVLAADEPGPPPDLLTDPVPTKLPPAFWSDKPQAAALALVQANLPKTLPPDFQIALDDRSGPAAPAITTLSFSTADYQYFLRIDPRNSYLAYGRHWNDRRISFRRDFLNRPAADLRLCPLPYQDARHLAEVVWWLDHIKTKSADENFTAADRGYADDAGEPGDGWLTLHGPDGQTILDDTQRLWQSAFSFAFNGYCDRESLMNFTFFLFRQALPERLGPVWTMADPTPPQLSSAADSLYSPAERAKLQATTLTLLALYSPAQDRISHAVASCAARAAGDLVFPSAQPLLQQIVNTLPAPDKPLRLPEEVFRDEGRLFSHTPKSPTDAEKQALIQKSRNLTAERDAIKLGTTPGRPRELRDTAETALRQLRDASNPDALYTWATTAEPGNYWALWRLSLLDPPRYPTALEWWLQHVYPVETHLVVRDLQRVAPGRAEEILASRPSN